MSKEKFLKMLSALYSVCNRSDSDDPTKEDWTKHQMAGEAGCQQMDHMMNKLVEIGVITADEMQAFHDTLN